MEWKLYFTDEPKLGFVEGKELCMFGCFMPSMIELLLIVICSFVTMVY
jgi:hypothetical protein